MNRAFSLYLDLIRFFAACLVYVYHSNQRWLVKEPLWFSNYGHSSVIVFFVLSGFVIAYVTDTKENEWTSYAASRLSRVYSVVLPTLLLTLLLDGIGRQLQLDAYSYPFDQIPVRLLASLLMLNEVWFISITSFSNVPYWSITYEFWYYVLFGVISFLPRRQAIWVAVAILALLGPKLLLLAPIWYAGVLLYRWKSCEQMPLGVAWALTLGSTVLIVLVHALGLLDAMHARFAAWVGPVAYRELTFSKFFVADYLLCLLVVGNFAGMRRLCRDVRLDTPRLERAVRFVAGFTFTLYLMHQPLFLFWGSVLRGDPASLWPWFGVTLLTFASVWLLGLFTENKRHLLRQWVLQRLRALALRLPPRARVV
jgi:peptidoglycan/LPS O-acetylase OafA/YrhL